MDNTLYSIRMRSSRNERHISGAEKLAPAHSLEELAAAMVRRALRHDKGQAEQIFLTLEKVDPAQIMRLGLPDIRTICVESVDEGRAAALSMLVKAGVTYHAARSAIVTMAEGAAPDGESMRGAMLVDAVTGRRLEHDSQRGIRVSRMDLDDGAASYLERLLQPAKLDNPHVREALVLAAKVMHAPDIVAELCWSDDPGYTAGYIASPCLGYVRFPLLKPLGECRGGRAFFVNANVDLDRLYRYLEKQVVLIDRVGRMLPDERWSA